MTTTRPLAENSELGLICDVMSIVCCRFVFELSQRFMKGRESAEWIADFVLTDPGQ
jgi:hypothetical protein